MILQEVSYDCSHPLFHQIQSFPLIKQPDPITCGPVSALMILKRYGINVNLDEVQDNTKTEWFVYNEQPIGMTSPDYISRTLSQYGVSSKMRTGSLNLLKHHVSKNKPVIVLLRNGEKNWHYVVVIGFNELKVTIADPIGGRKRDMITEDFVGAWEFKTDMYGDSVALKCPICKGSGRWIEKFGPLGICEICSGSGRQPDYVGVLLRAADIYPFTMIVPEIGALE